MFGVQSLQTLDELQNYFQRREMLESKETWLNFENPNHHPRISRRPHLRPRQADVGEDAAHPARLAEVRAGHPARAGFEGLAEARRFPRRTIGIGDPPREREARRGVAWHPGLSINLRR